MDGEELGEVQQAFVDKDAFQCGYCTSGQIMAVEGLLRKTAEPSEDEIRRGCSGNLCRCGAYQNIFSAAEQAGKAKKANQAELDKIDSDIDALSASSQYLSPDDIFALAELANKRMTWTEKFNVLGKILPKDVAITEMYYDYQVRVLRIKGISRVNPQLKDLDLVVSIVDLIKNNKDFSKNFADIRFTSSTRIKHDTQEMVEFEIECLVG